MKETKQDHFIMTNAELDILPVFYLDKQFPALAIPRVLTPKIPANGIRTAAE